MIINIAAIFVARAKVQMIMEYGIAMNVHTMFVHNVFNDILILNCFH